MEIKYDKEANALLILLKTGERSAKTIQINHSSNADLNENGDVIALEFLGASHYIEGLEPYTRPERTISVQEFAEITGMTVNAIQMILRDEQDKPESERRLEGAYKEGDERRGQWRIPVKAVKSFQKSKKGRPPKTETA